MGEGDQGDQGGQDAHFFPDSGYWKVEDGKGGTRREAEEDQFNIST